MMLQEFSKSKELTNEYFLLSYGDYLKTERYVLAKYLKSKFDCLIERQWRDWLAGFYTLSISKKDPEMIEKVVAVLDSIMVEQEINLNEVPQHFLDFYYQVEAEESIEYYTNHIDLSDELDMPDIQEVVIYTGGLLQTTLSLNTQCVKNTTLNLRDYVQDNVPKEVVLPLFLKYFSGSFTGNGLDIVFTPSCSFAEQSLWNDIVQHLFDEGKLNV
jgi:hypothetical protein